MKFFAFLFCLVFSHISFAQSPAAENHQSRSLFMCFLAYHRLEQVQKKSTYSLTLPFVDYNERTNRATKIVATLDSSHVVYLSPTGFDVIDLKKNQVNTKGIIQVSLANDDSPDDNPKDLEDPNYIPNRFLHVSKLVSIKPQRRALSFPDGTKIILDLPFKADGTGYDNDSPISYSPSLTDFKKVDFEQRLKILEFSEQQARRKLVIDQEKQAEACKNSSSGGFLAIMSDILTGEKSQSSNGRTPYDLNVQLSKNFVKKFDDEIERTKKWQDSDAKQRKDFEEAIPKLSPSSTPSAESEKIIKNFLAAKIKSEFNNLLNNHLSIFKPEAMALAKNCQGVQWNGDLSELSSAGAAIQAWPDVARSGKINTTPMGSINESADQKPPADFWELFREGVETAKIFLPSTPSQ